MQNDAIIRCVCDVYMRREIVENAEDDLVISLSLFYIHSCVSHDVNIVILHIF